MNPTLHPDASVSSTDRNASSIPHSEGAVRPGRTDATSETSTSAALQSLFDAATDLVVALEAPGRIVYANRAFQEKLGTPEDPVPGRNLIEFVQSFETAHCQAWLGSLFPGETGGAVAAAAGKVRWVLRTAEGQDLPVEATVTRFSGEGAARVLVLLVDISHREREAKRHQEDTDLLHLLGQHAPWGVFITDSAGRLRFANRRWRSLAGLLHVPKPRGVWWQMVHPDDRPRVLAQWQSALAGGHEFSSEFKVTGPDPDRRWVRTRVSQTWDREGRPGACVGITEDVTLQRQAEDVLRKAHEHLEETVRDRTEELQETNRELTSVVYAVTHDLKTPLRGIDRLADWLAEDHSAQLAPEGKTLIVKLQARVRQLHALIDGILAYNRIGRASDTELPVDLGSVVSELARLLDPPAHIKIIAPGPLPTVTGIPHQVRQLFQNLLDNAVKFMDKPEGRIQVTCHRNGQAWEFCVSDNGPGIPARFHEKIFSLFQRLDTAPDRPGTGIGLALVKRIVENRGGRISVDSEEGHGTTFTFTWPDHRKPQHRH